MLPLNFGISCFGNLIRASEDLDDVKELFAGLLTAGSSRIKSILLTRLKFRPLLSKFLTVPSHCSLAQVHFNFFCRVP